MAVPQPEESTDDLDDPTFGSGMEPAPSFMAPSPPVAPG